MYALKLDGWRRIWVVTTVIWAFVCVAALIALSGPDFFGPFLGMRVRWTIIAWLIPSVLLYALGWTLSWALRGLKNRLL